MDNLIFIAEVGVNHNGSIDTAKKLIDVAKKAGADIVKFQTFKTENVVTKAARMADYQKNNLGKEETQFGMLKKLKLSYDDFKVLKDYCNSVKIEFLSTGFDLDSLNFLASLRPKYWKVPSGEINNLPYIEFIARQAGDIFISTGMSTMDEVIEALNVFKQIRGSLQGIYIMHCTSHYPAKLDEINLNVLLTYRNTFGENIGYSDHSMGIEVSLGSIALGAKVIEKHITLDVNQFGPDHKASILPEELENLVRLGRNIFKSLGDKEKIVTAAEKHTRQIARKSIVAKCAIKKGEMFNVDNISVKRPGLGISPMLWYQVLGKTATRDYNEDDLLEEQV